jgi:hypothetical protein
LAEQADGSLVAAWGFQGGAREFIKEYLASVYSIPEDGVVEVEGANYEFKLFMLHPTVKISFRKPLFAQHKLKPIVPAVAGFQFTAESHDEALAQAESVVEAVRAFERMRSLNVLSPEQVMRRIASACFTPVQVVGDLASALVAS